MKTLLSLLLFCDFSFGQATPGFLSFYGNGGGTAQAQTVTISQPYSLVSGQPQVCWKPSVANTGAAPTLLITANGVALTATAVTKLGATALVAGDIAIGAWACVIYDGTQFQLQNPQTVSGGGSSTMTPVGPYNLFGGFYDGTQVVSVNAGTASYSQSYLITLPVSIVSNHLVIYVTTASGTSCTGGTCGLAATVWNTALTSKICTITNGTSGGTYNINATGFLALQWLSGTGVVSNTCTLPAGPSIITATSDSSTLRIAATSYSSGSTTIAAAASTAYAGYASPAATGVTGNGATLAFPSSLSSVTWNSNGGNNWGGFWVSN